MSVDEALVTWTTVWPEIVLRAESVARLMSKSAGCGVGYHAGDILLLQVDLVRSDSAVGRRHRRVGIHFNALALVDGRRVKGEGGAGKTAAKAVAGFYTELTGAEPGDIYGETGSDSRVIHAVADAVLRRPGQRGSADGGDQAFNFCSSIAFQLFNLFGEQAAIGGGVPSVNRARLLYIVAAILTKNISSAARDGTGLRFRALE